MIRTKYILIIIAAVSLISCADFLEPKSENEFVPTTVQALDEMLLFETYSNATSCVVPFFDFLSDDAAVVRFSGSENDILTQVRLAPLKALFSWQPDAYRTLEEARVYESVYDVYSGGYSRILGCNAVLDYIETVEGPQEDRNRLCAEAHALRGFWYFHLVNTYGQPYYYDKSSLGVPLHLTSHVSSASIPRNTVEEVYEQVLKDLTIAEELFMKVPETWKKNMRVSLPFVQLLLSRVYLYIENWELAIEYAEKVIADTQFRLIEPAEFPQDDDSYMYFHSYSNPEVIWPYANASEFRDFVDPYMMDISKGGKVSFVVADANLLTLFDDDDIRRRHYLVPDKRSPNYKAFGKLALSGGDNSPDVINCFARSFRLSEAYLNAAEAHAMLYMDGKGDKHKDEAIGFLNHLWSKRISTVPDSYLDNRSAARLVNSVREERRRELCFEDHRWFDLRRYGMNEMTHTWMGDKSDNQRTVYTLSKNDPMYTLPIPNGPMLLNTKLIQNPTGPSRFD